MLFQKILIAMMILGSMLTACSDATKTSTDTIFVNNSGHDIIITPYFQGAIYINDVLEIKQAEIETFNKTTRGLVKTGTSYASWLLAADSIVVNYGNSIKKVHLSKKIVSNTAMALQFDEVRNILNEKSYIFRIKESSIRKQEVEYEYTFTKADYEEALK